MALPLRYRLTSVLVGLNIVTIGVLATFAYRTSRSSLQQEALVTAGGVADARLEELARLLESHHQRLNGFLASLVSLCGERGPNRQLAFEPECVRVAVTGLSEAERASAVELRYRGRRIAGRGVWTGSLPANSPSTLTLMRATGNGAEYTMNAVRGLLTLRARFVRGNLGEMFQDRSGLGQNGDVLLLDSGAKVLTATRPHPAGLNVGPPETIAACLAGQSGEDLDRDESGNAVFIGFRPVPAIGGGCIVTKLQYSEVLAPLNRLGRTFLYASAAFVILGITLSFLLSHAIAKPIARLVAAARAVEEGQFEPPAAMGGPAEVRTLQRTFSRMATAIGDLVRREQAARLHAEAASRLKDDFLAAMSHELRTPLNAILGWAAIAAHARGSDARTADALRAIERNARAQARLIDDLLDVSRIASGRMRLNRTTVSLTAVIDAAIETVRPAAEAKSINIVKHVDATPCKITGDAQRLQPVVWNLLSNAGRFTPAHGRVDVRLAERDGHAELRVADTGSGIAPEFLPHVFEPFRQGDGGATRRHGGLGLGLAIVRQLIELHGGTVVAESDGHDRGATFTIHLPLRIETPVAAVSAPARSTTERNLRGARVVIVDDDPDARDILATLFEDAGATVSAAASAEEARLLFKAVQPDLLIADIGMPGEDGYSLMRSIRTARSGPSDSTPAIALTAHAQREDVERALEAGFQLHIAKPVDPMHLLAKAATLMTSPEAN